MEFGLFTEFHSPPGVSEAAAFDESLAQMKAAEDFGFDAVWLAEIHFQKDRSVLAVPLIIASAVGRERSASRSASRHHSLVLASALWTGPDEQLHGHETKVLWTSSGRAGTRSTKKVAEARFSKHCRVVQ